MHMNRLTRKRKLARRAFHRMCNHNCKIFGIPVETRSLTKEELKKYFPFGDNSYIDKFPAYWRFPIKHLETGVFIILNGFEDEQCDLAGIALKPCHHWLKDAKVVAING